MEIVAGAMLCGLFVAALCLTVTTVLMAISGFAKHDYSVALLSLGLAFLCMCIVAVTVYAFVNLCLRR